MNDTQLFAFESDFVSSLRCIPMAVRLKLDVCGIKLSLRQWSRFTRGDREAMLVAPCNEIAEVEAYRAALVALVALRTNEVAKPLADPPCGQWNNARQVAAVVIAYARSLGAPPPIPSQWAGLSPLQRFVLIKLTRDNHDNINFIPAMSEFGLLCAPRPDLAVSNLATRESLLLPACRLLGRSKRPSTSVAVRPESDVAAADLTGPCRLLGSAV